MVGAEGIFAPLLKKIIEASLEGELDTHLSENRIVEKTNATDMGEKIFKALWGL